MKVNSPFRAAALQDLKPGAVFCGKMFRGELVRFLRVNHQNTLGAVAIGPYWADENVVHYYDNSALQGIRCFLDESESVEFSLTSLSETTSNDDQWRARPGRVYIAPDDRKWLSVRTSRRHVAMADLVTGELSYELDTANCFYIDHYSLIRIDGAGNEVVLFDSRPSRSPLEVAA